MRNVLRQWLARLLVEGSLPASSVPRAAKPDIENVKGAGFIRWEKSGAGAKFVVADEAALRDLLDSTGYDGNMAVLTPKARAVALHADAHRGRDNSLLLMLSTAVPCKWTNGVNDLDIYEHVSQFGIASLVVRPGDQWRTDLPIGVVENLDLVRYGKAYFEQIGFNGSLLYYAGWLSKALLDWLTESRRAPSFVVFPDYDPVGIKNYLLAKERLAEDTAIYIPENLPDLLARFGNPERLESKTPRKMIESSGDQDAIRLYKALLDAGKGLDQESLLLSGVAFK